MLSTKKNNTNANFDGPSILTAKRTIRQLFQFKTFPEVINETSMKLTYLANPDDTLNDFKYDTKTTVK